MFVPDSAWDVVEEVWPDEGDIDDFATAIQAYKTGLIVQPDALRYVVGPIGTGRTSYQPEKPRRCGEA
jgi:hypothetical protein